MDLQKNCIYSLLLKVTIWSISEDFLSLFGESLTLRKCTSFDQAASNDKYLDLFSNCKLDHFFDHFTRDSRDILVTIVSPTSLIWIYFGEFDSSWKIRTSPTKYHLAKRHHQSFWDLSITTKFLKRSLCLSLDDEWNEVMNLFSVTLKLLMLWDIYLPKNLKLHHYNYKAFQLNKTKWFSGRLIM